MPRLRLALAQADPTLGDPAGISFLMLDWTARAAGAGAHLVAFPEFVPAGPAADDLAERLADGGLGETVVLAGGTPPHPAMVALHRGRRVATHVAGDPPTLVRVGGVDVSLGAPSPAAGLVVRCDGAPYALCETDARLAGLARDAAVADAAVASVNLVGGRDELVFDGDSMVVRPDGALIARAPQFVEHLLVLDLDLPAGTAPGPVTLSEAFPPPAQPAPAPQIAARVAGPAEVWQALVLSLRDYARKHGLRSATLELCGGLESEVCAVIACDALGPANVVGVSFEEGSLFEGRDLALRTGLDYRAEAIQPMVDGFLANLALAGSAQVDLEDRVRGVVLAALADTERHLVLGVGRPPVYGDFDPLKDVPPVLLHSLAWWRNEEAERRGEPAPISLGADPRPVRSPRVAGAMPGPRLL